MATTSSQARRYSPTPATYGRNTRGLPGTLAPMYHELANGNREMSAPSLTWRPHPSSACWVASIVSNPPSRRSRNVSAMKSTCCSIDTDMFDSTDGLPGPVIMNRLGKPTLNRPR